MMRTDQPAHDDVARRAAESIDETRLLASIETLAAFGARPDGGVNRPALSATDLDARRYLVERAHALGLSLIHI